MKKYFYNSPNKKVAIYHEKKSVLIKMAQEEECEIIIRDNTGAAIEVINKK